MSPIGKRIALSLMTAGAVTALVGGASFALFTAAANNDTNTFAAGTVSFSAPSQPVVCPEVKNMAPGDTNSSCTYDVTYSGTLNAWLGLNASESGDLFGGSTPATASVTAAAASGNKTCTKPISPLAVPPSGIPIASPPAFVCEVADGDSVTFTTNVTLPIGAGNSYQGATGTVTLDAVAVQHRNNALFGILPAHWQ